MSKISWAKRYLNMKGKELNKGRNEKYLKKSYPTITIWESTESHLLSIATSLDISRCGNGLNRTELCKA